MLYSYEINFRIKKGSSKKILIFLRRSIIHNYNLYFFKIYSNYQLFKQMGIGVII